MSETNKKHQKDMPLYFLFGDMAQSDTRKARELLDEARIEYDFVPADRLSEILPHLSSGLTSYIGLYQIARLSDRAKHRRALTRAV